jgi:hypothetical protein
MAITKVYEVHFRICFLTESKLNQQPIVILFKLDALLAVEENENPCFSFRTLLFITKVCRKISYECGTNVVAFPKIFKL